MSLCSVNEVCTDIFGISLITKPEISPVRINVGTDNTSRVNAVSLELLPGRVLRTTTA
jgi:hypothetical protein